MRIPTIFFLRINFKGYIKLFHVHTGFNDYCLLWISYGKLMDVLFFKVTK